MKIEFTSSRWFLLLVTIILPLILLAIAAVLDANICIIIAILIWIGSALMIIYMPRNERQNP
ncbi:MAG: hypothetical protein GX369_04200 [Euryarchaeota archaeon]|nr:hypothetical protein [Euryarchaeota archaeon]